MDMTIVLFIINGLMGVIMFFIGNAIADTKDKFKELKEEQDKLRDTTMKTDHFKEFKQDLFRELERWLAARQVQ